MKAIVLTAYFTVAVTCTLAATNYKIPNWINIISSNAAISSHGQNPDSRATCDIQNFKGCMLTFFGNIGLPSTSLPDKVTFGKQIKLRIRADPPQGFKDTSSYMKTLSVCVPSDCWTMSNMIQLGFPGERNDVLAIFSIFLRYEYICTTGYQTAVDNFNCTFLSQSAATDAIGCAKQAYSCADIIADLVCVDNAYSKDCNKDVGKMWCGAIGALAKALNPDCNPTDIDNACNAGAGLKFHLPSVIISFFAVFFLAILKNA